MKPPTPPSSCTQGSGSPSPLSSSPWESHPAPSHPSTPINQRPLLQHHKQALWKLSIALCPHWLKAESPWPRGDLTSPGSGSILLFYSITPFGASQHFPASTHKGLLLHYPKRLQGRNKQANLSWTDPAFPTAAARTWRTPAIHSGLLIWIYCSMNFSLLFCLPLSWPRWHQFNKTEWHSES